MGRHLPEVGVRFEIIHSDYKQEKRPMCRFSCLQIFLPDYLYHIGPQGKSLLQLREQFLKTVR